MALFEYTGVDSSGQSIKGDVEAMDRKAAIAELSLRGQFASDLTEKDGETTATIAKDFSFNFRRSRINDKKILEMTSQLATALKAGLPILNALEILKKARDDSGWREETRQMNRELLESSSRTLKARAPRMDRNIEAQFGEGAYVRNFSDIISDFGSKKPTPSPSKVRDSVRKAFGRIDYIRLLYDD